MIVSSALGIQTTSTSICVCHNAEELYQRQKVRHGQLAMISLMENERIINVIFLLFEGFMNTIH